MRLMIKGIEKGGKTKLRLYCLTVDRRKEVSSLFYIHLVILYIHVYMSIYLN